MTTASAYFPGGPLSSRTVDAPELLRDPGQSAKIAGLICPHDRLDRIVLTIRRVFLTIATLSVALTMVGGKAHAQSFDCHRAVTTIEHAICQDRTLGQLDDDLARQLKASFADSPDQQQFILGTERRWIANRDAQCEVLDPKKQHSCLELAYQKRIGDLKDLLLIHQESPPTSADAIGSILKVWQGDYGTTAKEIELILLLDRYDMLDGGRPCVRMGYRVVGQRDNVFVLEVEAPAQCLGAGQRGLYTVLIPDKDNNDGLTFRECTSAGDALKLWRNAKNRDVSCSDLRLHTSGTDQTDIAKVASSHERAEYDGSCGRHRVHLTAQQVTLIGALGYNNESQVRDILSHPIDVNFDSYGWTPLSVAAFQGNLKMVKALLDAGGKFAMPTGKASKWHCDSIETFDDLVLLSNVFASGSAIKEALMQSSQAGKN